MEYVVAGSDEDYRKYVEQNNLTEKESRQLRSITQLQFAPGTVKVRFLPGHEKSSLYNHSWSREFL